jgi:hypothetical protein
LGDAGLAVMPASSCRPNVMPLRPGHGRLGVLGTRGTRQTRSGTGGKRKGGEAAIKEQGGHAVGSSGWPVTAADFAASATGRARKHDRK